jgi:hypothetical protein
MKYHLETEINSDLHDCGIVQVSSRWTIRLWYRGEHVRSQWSIYIKEIMKVAFYNLSVYICNIKLERLCSNTRIHNTWRSQDQNKDDGGVTTCWRSNNQQTQADCLHRSQTLYHCCFHKISRNQTSRKHNEHIQSATWDNTVTCDASEHNSWSCKDRTCKERKIKKLRIFTTRSPLCYAVYYTVFLSVIKTLFSPPLRVFISPLHEINGSSKLLGLFSY